MDQFETVVRATARENIWDGAVRAGKTVASKDAWLVNLAQCAEQFPGSIHAIVGKTTVTAERNIVVENLRPQLGSYLVERRSHVEVFGQRVEVFGANDDRAVDKLMGVTLRSALCDEISTWSPRYYAMLLTRLSPRGARLFGTTNPEGPYHWLKEVIDSEHVNRFHMTIFDNQHLDPKARDDIIRNMRERGQMYYDRYILGKWVAAEGAVYDFGGCVVTSLPEMTGFRAVGFDHGTSVPSAAVELCQGEDGRVYVTRELYWNPTEGGRLTEQEQVDMLLEWVERGGPMCNLFVDPAAAGFRMALLRRGVTPYGGQRNLADIRIVKRGLTSVQEVFSRKELLIHSSCENLVRELQGYSWDPKATARGEDRPLKVNDHAADALRYAVVGERRLWT